MGQKLSTVEQKLEAVDNREPVPAITQPSHPPVTPSAEEPTHSPIMTTHAPSDSNESVLTAPDKKNDEASTSVGNHGTGTTTIAPKREPATPHMDTTASTGATDDILQEENTLELVESFSNSTNNVTESEDATVAEEAAITTNNLPPGSVNDFMEEKKKNEQAIAALRSKPHF